MTVGFGHSGNIGRNIGGNVGKIVSDIVGRIVDMPTRADVFWLVEIGWV